MRIQRRFLQRALLLVSIPLALLACATRGPEGVTEKGAGTIQGYLDYSYDKNSVLFTTADRYTQTVFFDTIYPFDPALRYNNAQPIVRYQLDHKPFTRDGILMVALADLRKIYAPYFSYSVDGATQQFTVTHHYFAKRVASGVGSRAPRVEYTKNVYQGSYALASSGATVSHARYATATDRNAIDKTAVVSSAPPNAATLDAAPVARDGRIYVPVASFMRTLGKTIATGNSGGGAGTMNFAIRHPSLFRAMAPTAPGSSKPRAADMKGPILDMPTLMSCYTADITVFYAAHPSNACQPWYLAQVKDRLRNVTFVTVENGHHSYGAASLNEMTFEFFDRVLDSTAGKDVANVRFVPGTRSATVTTAGGATSAVALGAAPVGQNGTVMVALDDLARIYGASDFKVYDIYAYNRTPSDVVAVKTIKYNRVAVNLKSGEKFLRVGGTVHAGDTTGASTTVPAGDPSIDPRVLSVAANSANGRVYVPVVEFMRLFGKSVIAD